MAEPHAPAIFLPALLTSGATVALVSLLVASVIWCLSVLPMLAAPHREVTSLPYPRGTELITASKDYLG